MRLQPRFQSIRSIVTSIIMVLGLMSLAATLVTGQVYHSLTLRSQLENIERQLYLESNQTLQRLKQFSLQLSTLIINSDKFKNSLKQNKHKSLASYIANLPNLPFMQSGVLLVRYVYVYDEQNTLLAGINLNGVSSAVSSQKICKSELDAGKTISHAEVTDVVYALCINDKRPYLSARVPFSFNKQKGYVVLVSDISHNLSHIDQIINFPLRLRLNDDSVLFISDSWPGKYKESEIATNIIKNEDGSDVILVDALHIDANLDNALSYAQYLVISGAIFVIVLSVLSSLYIIRKTVIYPMNEVVDSLRLVRDNRANLGAQVKSRGADEIIKLMDDFNAMSSALNQLYDTLEKMTYTDSLTRLGNRKLFHEKLERLFEKAENSNSQIALLLIDLDKFKQVNDTYGHQLGDKLLIETSNRFSDVVRQSRFANLQTDEIISSPVQDVLARLGGDEFAVLLSDIKNKDEAIDIAKKLCNEIHKPTVLDEQTIDYGLSIGIAFYPDHAQDKEALIHCADEAMYHSKAKSFDYSVYDPD